MRKLHVHVVGQSAKLKIALLSFVTSLLIIARSFFQFSQDRYRGKLILTAFFAFGYFATSGQGIICTSDLPIPPGTTTITSPNGNVLNTTGDQAVNLFADSPPIPCGAIVPNFFVSVVPNAADGWFFTAILPPLINHNQSPLPASIVTYPTPGAPPVNVNVTALFSRFNPFPFLEFESVAISNQLFGIDDDDPILFAGTTPTVECDGDIEAAATGSIIINDCSNTTAVATVPAFDACTLPTTIMVDITVTDDCGNSEDITVPVDVEDNTPPNANGCPAGIDISLDATCMWTLTAAQAMTLSDAVAAMATDACDPGPITVTVIDPVPDAPNAPADNCGMPGMQAVEMADVTFRLTDCNGQTKDTTCTDLLTIIDDTAPTWDATACDDMAADPSTTIQSLPIDPVGPPVVDPATCTAIMPDLRALALMELEDNCGATMSVDDVMQTPAPGTILTDPGDGCGPAGPVVYTVDVSFNAVDCNGNAAPQLDCPGLVTVEDNEDPEYTCPATPIVVTILADPVTCVYGSVTLPTDLFDDTGEVDNCDPDPVASNPALVFDCNDLGLQDVPVTVTDCNGNDIIVICQVEVVIDENDAFWDNPGPLCTSDGIVDLCTFLGPDAETCGTWEGDIVTAGQCSPLGAGGQFDAAAAGPGSYSVTYTVGNPDCHTELTRTIIVEQNFDADLIDDFSVCWSPDQILDLETLLAATTPEGGVWAIVSQTPVLGGPVGGITLLSGPGNDHVIRYDGGCLDATISYTLTDCSGTVETDEIVVTIQETPIAQFDVASEFCQDEGNYTIGNVRRTLSGCNDYDVMFEVVQGPAPLTQDLIGGAIVSGPIAGFPPVVVNPGVRAGRYTIRLTISDPNGICPDVEHEETVIIHADAANPNGIVNNGPFCESDAFPISLEVEDPTDVAGNPILPGDVRFFGQGVIDGPGVTGRLTPPDTDGDGNPGPGTFTVCVNLGDARCTDTYCEDFVIEDDVEDPDLVADFSICTEPDELFAFSGLLDADDLPGGVWSLAGPPTGTAMGSLGPNGLIYSGGCGTITLQYEFPDDCNPPATPAQVTITFNERPDIDLVAQGPFCVLDPATIIANNANVPVCGEFGTFSGPGITDNGDGTASFDPAAAGEGTHTIMYTIMTAAGCSEDGSVQITVFAASDPTFVVDRDFCEDDVAIVLALQNPDPSVLGGGSAVPPTEDGNVEVSWNAGCGACLTDNGDGTATFDPSQAEIGVNLICVQTGDPNCAQSHCEVVIVHEGIDAGLAGDRNRGCFDFSQNGPFTDFDVSEFYLPTTTRGGVWSYVSGDGGTLRNETLSALPGCHQLRYTVEAAFAGADGECAEMTDDVFLLLTEEPQPAFDLAEEVCWDGVAGSIILPTLYNGDTWGNNSTRTYDWVATLNSGAGPIPTFSDATAMEPTVSIQGAGVFEICLTETLTFAACGTQPAGIDCDNQICHLLTVTETAVEVVPTWTAVGPFCIDDARVYLGAASAGMGVGQVTGNPDGVFTGNGVVEDPAGSGEYYFDPAVATDGSHIVCYTVQNGSGCTATECHDIEVFPAAVIGGTLITALECATERTGFNFFSLPNGDVLRSNYTPGQYNLQDLLSPDTKLGGTWTLVSTPTPSAAFTTPIAQVYGGNLYYSDPGCYEMQYAVECFPGADGACVATENFFVQIGERPTAFFDLPDSYCIEDGDLPLTLDIGLYFDETVFHPTSTRRRSYRFTSSDAGVISPASQTRTTSADFMPQIVGQGTVEICVLEGLNSAAGGMCGTTETFCPREYCETITIVSASETLDPSWDPAGPFCVDDACIDLDALVTGTPNGVFTGPGVSPDPANPDYQFCPATAGVGSHVVTYTVVTPEGCESSFSRTIEVFGEVEADIADRHIMCAVAPSGAVSLSSMYTGTTTPGGTFSLVSGPASGMVVGGVLIYSEAGCYEIMYTALAFPGADGLCMDTDIAFLLISEQPQPSFDIQDQVCFSDGDADINLTPLVNSPMYDAASTLSVNWDVIDNVTGATATIDMATGVVTLSDDAGAATITGTIEVCYVEELEWDACGSFAATTAGTNGDGCSETICMTITVEDGTSLDAGFTVSNMEPCPGEVVTLTANMNGGVFTGPGVTDDGNGSTGSLQIGECGVYAVTYTISSPNGCTNSFTANITTDRTDPILTTPMDTTVECDGAGNTAALQAWLDMVSATDNCDFDIDTILFNSISGCHSNVGTMVYQFIATDTCGNESIGFASFTIADTTAPVITGGADMLMEECTAPPAGNFPEFDFWLSDNAGATADDLCGDRVFWTNDFDPANWMTICGNSRFVDVIFYAEDECGNVDSIMHRFAIGDVTPPMFTNCPRPEITASAPPTWCSAFVNFSPPAATDNCSGVTLTRLDVTGLESGDLFPVGITVLTWEARDSCDNADTCSLKVIVNDFHTPPTFECPAAPPVANNDPGICGADVAAQLGVDLSPTDIEDNCPDNLAITYEVRDEAGELIGCGIESVNGFVFPVGTSEVKYRIQDQPILLITEIVQDGPDAVEITNFGPAAMEISCLQIERVGNGDEIHIVPIGTILQAGEVYVANLMNDIGYTDPATYTIGIKGTILDQINTNGFLDGGDIWRTVICDTDSEIDWEVTVECKASLGMLNPGVPAFPPNGTKTGIQTVLPSMDMCMFEVEVVDNENPMCAMLDTTEYAGAPITAPGQLCVELDVIIPDNRVVGGIIISNLGINYPELNDLALSLVGPDGTEVEIFNRPCTTVPNMQVNFDDAGVMRIADANCTADLNGDETWMPDEAFKAFYGKSSAGTWTLELSVDGVETVEVEDGWTLDIIELLPFDDSPITIDVDPNTAPDMCGDTLDWLHPVLQDNCCEGTLVVAYSTLDADTLPMGGPITGGSMASEFFGLGTTTVTYTLTDAAGNSAMCSFDVIVEDPLGLCTPDCQSNCQVSCIQDINVSLNENCEVPVVPSMISEAINAECDFYYDIEIRDEHGNLLPSDTLNMDHVGHCFTVTLIEPECGNSCWTNVCVEDKFPPIIECNDDTMNCIEYQFGFDEPIVTEHCGTFELRLIDEKITNLDCDPGFQKFVTQKWVAIDNSGNVSDTCEQVISISRFPMGEIEGPNMDTSIYCGSGFAALPNGFPDPSVTGVPMYDTLSLFPLPDFFCNMLTEYRDVPVSNINCTRSIMRIWTVTEWWCREDSTRTFNQRITLIDTVGPVISGLPDTIKAKAGQRSCDALVDLPVPTVVDECFSVDRIDVVYPGGFAGDYQGGLVRLPIGIDTVVYRAYDTCYNLSTDTLIVVVTDDVAPIAICEQNTVVTLDNDGVVHIYAETFDDGSFDECKLDKMEVRRMIDNCGSGTDEWGDYVEFCCDDIGDEIMVAFRVTDKSGNVNTCMVRATVQDKQDPRVTDLPDIRVDCRFDIDYTNLNVFGKFVFDIADRDSIIIDAEDVTIFGAPLDGLVYDNCPPVIEEKLDTSGLGNCGNGFIIRDFTFTDAAGNSTTSQQRIEIFNNRPFTEAQIIWPRDIDTVNVCGAANFRPELLKINEAFPRFIDEDECSLVGYDYKDELVDASIGSEACFKIFRTWTVIDWCQKDNNGFHVKWTHEQLIVVENTNAPVFTSECVDTVRCVFSPTCEPDSITLQATALDDCTIQEDLFWRYKIDIDNDGTNDIIERGNDATGLYPIGVHRIKWIVEDLCGNRDSCSYLFELRNCKAPTAYCKNGVVAELTPMDTTGDGQPDTEMAEVWASDFDENSGHVCGHPVVLSFSADTSDKVRMYTCDSLNPGIREVTIYVTDKITGNVSRCKTFINVQDNNNVDLCPGTLTGGIVGEIGTEWDVMVEEAEVSLLGSSLNSEMTDRVGEYAFQQVPLGGMYEIMPEKDGDDLNGVSTGDLIRIQRHLLGKKEFTSPYQYIAADANNSESVTAADIAELRKLILGAFPEFPRNTSWRFVDKSYDFPDKQDPWLEEFPESYNLTPMNQDMDVDFVGVKIGDLNGDVQFNANGTQTRTQRDIILEDGEIRSGRMYEVIFNIEDLSELAGYQFTVEWNTAFLELSEVVPNLGLDMNLNNFNMAQIEDGVFTTSWATEEEIRQGEERLFAVRFNATGNGRLSELINISSRVTVKECYALSGDGEVIAEDLELTFRGGSESNYFALYQNEPNPWNETTVIGFHIPNADEVLMTIFDETGRVVKIVEAQYQEGYNEIQLSANALSGIGVLYYRLESTGHTATRKMILID